MRQYSCPHCHGLIEDDGSVTDQAIRCPICAERFETPLVLPPEARDQRDIVTDGPSTTWALVAFCQGFFAPWHGFLYMNRNPSLWRFAVLPILLNVLITIVVLLLLIAGVVALLAYLPSIFPATAYGLMLGALTAVGLIALAIGLTIATWLLAQAILLGHYYGKLAREVEGRLGLHRGEMKDVALLPRTIDALRDCIWLLTINLACLTLALIPVIGTVLGICGTIYFDSCIFGRAFLDYPLAIRGLRRAEKIKFARRHRAHVLGLGTVVLFFHWIPVLGAIILSTAVTGAVLLQRRLEPVQRGDS